MGVSVAGDGTKLPVDDVVEQDTCRLPEELRADLSCLMIPLSSRIPAHLIELLRADRARRGTRYRLLTPSRQALLVLAHLRNGDTAARLLGFTASSMR